MSVETIPPEWNVQIWFSLGTTTGLSIVSIGTPGLKSELDEQVFAGGMTAISHLLGSEIGVTQDDFVGGGDTSCVGRFKIVNTEREREAIAQFLLVSHGLKIPSELIEFSKIFVQNFGTKLLASSLWDRVEEEHAVLSISKTLKEILEGLHRARTQMGRGKVPIINTALEEAIKQQIEVGIVDYSFSPLLEELATSPFQEAVSIIKWKRGELLKDFTNDCLLAVLEKNPLPLILMQEPRNSVRTVKQILDKQFSILETQSIHYLEKLSRTLLDREIADILDSFDLINLHSQKNELKVQIQKDLSKKLVQKHPLLVLINPSLKGKSGSLEQTVNLILTNILTEHDLGGTLGKIGELILPKKSLSGPFIADFIRAFCNGFPRGLTYHAWEYIQTLYEILCFEQDIKFSEVLKSADIPPSHKNLVQKKLLAASKTPKQKSKKVKEFASEIIFTVTEAELFQRFLSALTGAISRGFQQIYNGVIFSCDGKKSEIGLLPQRYTLRCKELALKGQTAHIILNALKFFGNKRWGVLDLNGGLPNLKIFGDFSTPKISLKQAQQDVMNLHNLWTNPNIIINSFQEVAITGIRDTAHLLFENIDDLENSFLTNLEKITKYLKSSKQSDPSLKIDLPQFKPLNREYCELFKEQHRQFTQSANNIRKTLENILKSADNVKMAPPTRKVKLEQRVLNEIEQQTKKFKIQFSTLKNNIRNIQTRSEKDVQRELSRSVKDLSVILLNAKTEIFKTSKRARKQVYQPPDTVQLTDLIKELAINYIRDPFTLNGHTYDVSRFYGDAFLFNDVPRPFKTAVLNQFITARRTPQVSELLNRWQKNHLKSLSDLMVDNLTSPAKSILLDSLHKLITKIEETFLQQNPIVVGWKGEVCVEVGRINFSLFKDNNFKTYLGDFYRYAISEDKKSVTLLLPIYKDHRTVDNFVFALRRNVFREVWDELEPLLNLMEFACNIFSEQTAKRFKEMISPFQKYEF
ncbi:MAG: hypothetical protein ACFFBD_21415 [Candidatus Hodarchaeota archaeon]